SLGEVGHVFDSVRGFDPARVLFTPSFAPIDEYAQAFERGVTVTVDNCELLQRWPEVFRGRALWLRIDLGFGDGHHEKVTTGGKASKFGLAASRVEESRRWLGRWACASPACTRTWAAAWRRASTGARWSMPWPASRAASA